MKIIRISQTELSESWHDDIDYLEELNLTIDEMLTKHNVNFQRMKINGNKIIVIYEPQETYIIDDPDNYPDAKGAEDWISQMWDNELDAYIPEEEHNFWNSPEPLYHATDSENIDSIKENGLREENQSRGISNRNVGSAVFASRSYEDIDSYGDTIITIDTPQMKQDGYTPNVSGEEPLEDSARRARLAYLIGLENYIPEQYTSEGYSDNTVVIYGRIPPKYLSFD